MTVRLMTADGRSFALPPALRWRILRTGGVPCDELEAVCLCDGAMGDILPLCHRFAAYEGTEALLLGVVDEYALSVEEGGMLLTVSGRGMAALLLDNEAEAESYQQATLAEILRRHGRPYLPCREGVSAEGGSYQVASGSSQWRAISGFTQRFGGFTPYVTALGELVAAPLRGSGKRLALDAGEIIRCRVRQRRYGVLSEVLVKDKGESAAVVNEDFRRRGGCRRQVLYMPRRSTGEALRYTAAYQLRQSAAGSWQTEVRLAGAFRAQPGDLAALRYPPLGLAGRYHVAEAESRGGAEGTTTTLVLEEAE